MKHSDAMDRAMHDYRASRLTMAASRYRTLTETQGAPEAVALEARFWLACCLQGLGERQAAIEELGPQHLRRPLLAKHPTLAYRCLTRLALLQIETGQPRTRIEGSLDGISRLEFSGRRSRLQLVQGRLQLAQGQRARAALTIAHSLSQRPGDPSPFADSAYFRCLVRCNLELGRLDRAQTELQRWECALEPPGFKLPHLLVLRAEWHRARGEPSEAVRWALGARALAADVEDQPGEAIVERALCRAGLQAGQPLLARSALAALLRLRQRAGADERFRIELARTDYHLTRACWELGRTLPDLEFDRWYASPSPAGGGRTGAARALQCARHAQEDAQLLARHLDAAFESSFRQREVRQRDRFLRKLTKTMSRAQVAVPRRGRTGEAATEPIRAPEPPEGDFAVVSDLEYRWLFIRISGLRSLVRLLRRTLDFVLVARQCESGGALQLDVWRGTRLLGHAWLRVSGKRPTQLALAVPAGPAPDWLQEIETQARRILADERFRKGAKALGRCDWQEAARCFESASEHRPHRAKVWERKAVCLLALGEPQAALDHATRALELDSQVAQHWQTAADVLEALGRGADARRGYEHAAARLPEDSKRD